MFITSSDTELVFTDRAEAFQMLKRVRESRVKAFDTYDEAVRFSKGLENSPELEVPTVIISAELNGNLTNNHHSGCDKTVIKGREYHGMIIQTDFS